MKKATAVFLAESGDLGNHRAEMMVQYAARLHKRAAPSAIVIALPQMGGRLASKVPNPERLQIDEKLLNTKVEERFPFFQTQWQRYCHARNLYKPDEGGSRLKRARWHYAFLRERPIYPINIRLRAFFASDLTNFSYFDPTAGFERLCNMPPQKLPLEIALFRDDIARHVRGLDSGRRDPPLRPLKWCSTAIYWLTRQAADGLGTAHTFKDTPNAAKREIVFRLPAVRRVFPVPQVKYSDFHSAASELRSIVTYEPDPATASGIFQYVAGMGVKAIVQDYWKETDPAGRAYAHYRIAERLYENRHLKQALTLEFPIIPHWGRSRVFFLSECIRHLMRACAPIVAAKPPDHPSDLPDGFPNKPTRSFMGCDPHEVLSFCFRRVYWHEIDGNSSELDGRKLSRRHGLYHLSAELLQLMSDNEVLGNPHWALDRNFHGDYFSCAAFAQSQLGDLSGALKLLEKRYEHARETAPHSPKEMTAALDIVGVKIELHRLNGLIRIITEVEEKISKPGGAPEQSNQILLHCRILKGEIAYVEGNFDVAEAFLNFNHDEIDDVDLSVDASHYLVATLGGKAEVMAQSKGPSLADEVAIVEMRDKALQIASRRLWEFVSAGEQHVALGFRISIAHLFRNMGKYSLAETWMDSIYIDILRYGCSERTYLSFLREAGRIVFATDRPARAYAAYLKPAAIRAASRGYVRAATVAAKEAHLALEAILKLIDENGNDWATRLTEELRENEALSLESNTEMHDFVPTDPLFSFDLLSGAEWIEKLQDRNTVSEEGRRFSHEMDGLMESSSLAKDQTGSSVSGRS
jgi:tetratricopeptide (TPR) repeat protein